MFDSRIEELSDLLAVKSTKEAECFPVDRYFLEPYLKEIASLERNQFLLYNLERKNNTYTIQLLLCLPELWEDISIDDVLEIISKFTNIFSYYALIVFTHKYVEINIINLIFESSIVPSSTKSDIKKYLESQYPNFFKTESDILFFENGLYGVKIQDWKYIKQKLLLDKRVLPAFETIGEFEIYIKHLGNSTF